MSSSSSTASKITFTVRRPTPASRGESDSESSTFKIPTLPRHLSGANTSSNSPLGHSAPPTPKSRTYSERDSSDEGSDIEDELVTAFDHFGARRLHEKPKPQGPLVIPALKNKDWRELARKRKQIYLPPSAAATTGADGSVGGLGTRDTIHLGPQASGLQVKKRVKVEDEADVPMLDTSSAPAPEQPQKEESDDQKALRAILASATSGGDTEIDGPQIDIIPAPTEDDAYRQDVAELPDAATLDDYERVPVAQFGAALLRGMGWKEGTAASKKNKGPVDPWLPQSRPALLGIGAKEREVFDDGSKGKKGKKGRPEKRYVPVVKKERKTEGEQRDGDGTSSSRRHSSPPTRSGSTRQSPSPDPRRERVRDEDSSRDKYRDREYGKDRGRYDDRDWERDRVRYPGRERDRDSQRDDDPESSRRDLNRYEDSSRSKDRYDSSTKRDKHRY